MKNFIIILIPLLFFGCNKKETEITSASVPQKETVYVEKPRTAKTESPKPSSTPPKSDTPTPAPANVPISKSLAGSHRMVWKFMPQTSAILQISKKTDGKLDATGGDTAYGSSFSLEGEIRKVSDTELEFSGKIKTYQYGRNGYYCEEIKKARFIQPYDSEYYRYSYIDCKGTADYIDIF